MAKTVSKVLNKRSGKRPTKRSRKRPTKRSSKKKYVNKKKHTRKKVRKRKHSQKIIKGGSFMQNHIKTPSDAFKKALINLVLISKDLVLIPKSEQDKIKKLEQDLELDTHYLHIIKPSIIEDNEFVFCPVTDNTTFININKQNPNAVYDINLLFEIICGNSSDGKKHYILCNVNKGSKPNENKIKEIYYILESTVVKVHGESDYKSMETLIKWIEAKLMLKARHTYKSILIDLVVDLTTIMEIKINKNMIEYSKLTEDELKEYPSVWMGLYRVAGSNKMDKYLQPIYDLSLQGNYNELIINETYSIPRIVLNIKKIIGFMNIRNINLFNIDGQSAIDINNDTATSDADKFMKVYKFSSNPKTLNYMLIHLKKIKDCILLHIGTPINKDVIQKKTYYVNEAPLIMNFAFIYQPMTQLGNLSTPAAMEKQKNIEVALPIVFLLLYNNIVAHNTDTIATTIDTKMKLYHLKGVTPVFVMLREKKGPSRPHEAFHQLTADELEIHNTAFPTTASQRNTLANTHM
jgi:hypothetical protein